MLTAANVAVRFLLELAGLGAVVWWGLHAADGAGGWALALAAAASFIAIWGLFVAPRARFPQTPRVRLVAGTAILLVAALLLAAGGAVVPGAVLAVLVVVNAVGIAVLGDGGLTA